jgi:hypothetical protein
MSLCKQLPRSDNRSNTDDDDMACTLITGSAQPARHTFAMSRVIEDLKQRQASQPHGEPLLLVVTAAAVQPYMAAFSAPENGLRMPRHMGASHIQRNADLLDLINPTRQQEVRDGKRLCALVFDESTWCVPTAPHEIPDRMKALTELVRVARESHIPMYFVCQKYVQIQQSLLPPEVTLLHHYCTPGGVSRSTAVEIEPEAQPDSLAHPFATSNVPAS